MLNLIVRSQKKSGLAPLYTKVSVEKRSLWVNLLLEVDVTEWEKVTQAKTTIKRDNYLSRLGYTKKIQDIESSIRDLRRHHKLTEDTVNAAVHTIVYADTRERVQKARKLAVDLENRKNNNVKTYVITLVDKVISGEVRTITRGKYSPNSIKIWKQFRRIFLGFYEKHPFDWQDINTALIDTFVSYLEDDCGYMKSSYDRLLGLFKTIVRRAEENKVHTNYTAKSSFKMTAPKEDEKTKEIYLTKEELEALYDMKLEGFDEQVRDVFLIGCYTAQRFSDYGKIDETCIGVTAKGTRVIRLIQVKTKQLVVIPILDPKLEVLLKKYNYNVPQIWDVSLNRTIKKICEKLSETVPSLAVKERTILTKKERQMEVEAKKKGERLFEYDDKGYVLKPRWQMVSTHTARRSAITNMYLSGNYTKSQIMTVSGHKKESTFNLYIKLSQDEQADNVAKSSKDGMF